MSILVAVITGVLAFLGSIAGHFMAFDLNAAAKRREVRRAQIERFADLVGDDQTWLDDYMKDLLMGTKPERVTPAPYEKAFGIYTIYFQEELGKTMYELLQTRHAYERAVDETYVARLDRALESKKHVREIFASQEERKKVLDLRLPYAKAKNECLNVASKIVAETLPEQSEFQRILARFLPGSK